MRSATFANRFAQQPAISVKRSIWRMNDPVADSADISFRQVRDSVLKRENYVCFFCGFHAEKYQEIHHIDDDHHNNNQNNLRTVCNLCHMVHHIGMTAVNRAGFLAAIPELTQIEINQIMRVVHVSPLVDEELGSRLAVIETMFRQRATETLFPIFGIDISDPSILAELLRRSDSRTYEDRSNILKALRLVPTVNAFHPDQLKYYAGLSLFKNPASWNKLTEQLLKGLEKA